MSSLAIAKDAAESSTAALSNWSPVLAPGPYWGSFEQLRVSGGSALDSVVPGVVATLNCKSGTFRILQDSDFQKLVGLASEVHRLKSGLTFVVKAAKVVAKHPGDRESMELFFQSVSMLTESSLLPERNGHDRFELSAHEKAEHDAEEINLKPSDIPRPNLSHGGEKP